ncbi:MAG: hypothetical protein AAB515_04235 [Patescibacteria group bacterium]
METQTTQVTKLTSGLKLGIAVAVLSVVALGAALGYAVYVGGFAN